MKFLINLILFSCLLEEDIKPNVEILSIFSLSSWKDPPLSICFQYLLKDKASLPIKSKINLSKLDALKYPSMDLKFEMYFQRFLDDTSRFERTHQEHHFH